MKVIQVVPSILVEASGPSFSVPGLCRGLVENGCQAELHFADEMPKRQFEYPVFAHGRHNFPHPSLGRSPEMYKALKNACKEADIIHNNSFWMLPNVYPSWARRGSACKLINAPRGTLASWALRHHSLQKKLFGMYAQYAAMAATDMWHATCEKEYNEIRAAGYKQPVAVVPIGMDLPDTEFVLSYNKNGDGGSFRRLVFFGRLHKVKAVDNLILAWNNVASEFNSWELLIAGPDGGVQGELESAVREYNVPRVSFLGELHGKDKYKFLASAELCVLPSYTENFGVTVAESLACGTPVIASQGTPWSGLVSNYAGWWIPVGVDSLARQLKESLAMKEDQLHQMGENGRRWMKNDFAWKSIGNKMKLSYEWLLGRGDRPNWVFVD